MAFNVPTQQEFDALEKQVIDIKQTMKLLVDRITEKEKAPTEWLAKRDARKYFKRNGKEVPASTFNDWVQKWLANGTLVQGVNCKFAHGAILIAADFLRSGKCTEEQISPLKKVS